MTDGWKLLLVIRRPSDIPGSFKAHCCVFVQSVCASVFVQSVCASVFVQSVCASVFARSYHVFSSMPTKAMQLQNAILGVSLCLPY